MGRQHRWPRRCGERRTTASSRGATTVVVIELEGGTALHLGITVVTPAIELSAKAPNPTKKRTISLTKLENQVHSSWDASSRRSSAPSLYPRSRPIASNPSSTNNIAWREGVQSIIAPLETLAIGRLDSESKLSLPSFRDRTV
ncbi:hypothetical protein BHM03_00026784 [Ensete ventricosum]|nr:hypothetical protein BHM03_00026784 [Ensete ventricosum]